MRHRWIFVQLLAHAMAGPLAPHRAAGFFDIGLDGRPEMARPLAGLRRADAAPHRLLGYLHQPRSLWRDLADRVGHARIADPAVQPRADIDADNIALAQRRLAGEAVADHIIHRHAD